MQLVYVLSMSLIIGFIFRIRERIVKHFWILSFSIMLFLSAELFILIDITNYRIDEKTSYWFFSAILQAFAAMLGIIGGFIALQKPTIKEITRKSYPALVFLGIIVMLSIIFLPSVPFLVVYYPSVISTVVWLTLILAIYGIIYLLYSLHKLFKNF